MVSSLHLEAARENLLSAFPSPSPLLPFFRDGVDFEYALSASISAMAVLGVEALYFDRTAPIYGGYADSLELIFLSL